MALMYDILGSDARTPVLIVVIVRTVVIPDNKERMRKEWFIDTRITYLWTRISKQFPN